MHTGFALGLFVGMGILTATLGCSSSHASATSDAKATDAGAEAPDADSYPAGPYGSDVGATIADLDFAGWTAAPYDAASPARLRLGTYYDPKGEHGRKILVVNVCSVWCVQCHEAFGTFDAKAADYAPRGATIVSLLLENAEVKPIALSEAATYGSQNGVHIPLAIDPTYQMAAFLRPVEVPVYVVVSARDMTILGVLKDAAPADVWAFVDQKLAEIP